MMRKSISGSVLIAVIFLSFGATMVWAQATAQISGSVKDQSGAALPGFKTYVQSGIVLQVGTTPTVTAVLEVGQVSDQVEVKADASLVEARSSGVGNVIDMQRVLEMPLNGRNPTEL